MLAYSSISQMGYIVLGLGCGTPLGIVGAVFHLFNHAIFKTLLFVNSAAIEQRTGTTDMNRMGGLGSRMPVTGVTSTIAALSTAGVPPLAGFWSKLIIVIALWQAHDYGFAGIAVLMSVVTLAYLLLMQRRIFFGKTSPEHAGVREAAAGVVVPELVLAALTVAVGLLFPWVLNTFMLPVGGIFH
jgi:multicomponent Na+:H+ antiporter subunit D